MKKLLILGALAATSLVAGAQTLNVVVGDVTYAIPAAQAGEMLYNNGSSLTILGKQFALTDISRMYVDDTAVVDNMVKINYEGESAKLVVAGNLAQYLTTTVNGAYVSIIQSELVDDTTCGEITYALSGASDNGAFYMEGSYKSTVELRGLTLTNTIGAPLDIQNSKRIKMKIAEGTTNTLADCEGGKQKGTLVCKGHLEFSGKGELKLTGRTSHALYAKEYIEVKDCTISVLGSVKDGLNCNQYLMVESGVFNISNVGDDGIQVSYKDDTDRESEDIGSIIIKGGKFNVTATATATKAIKADGCVTITGGTLDLKTTGGGEWDEEDLKTKAAACISADENVQIDGGVVNMTSTGSGGEGISCDLDLTINGGEINVNTSGQIYAYVNGTEYPSYTGNSDNLESNQKSSPKGIKADGHVIINGGNVNITTTGNGGEGIESKSEMTIKDGTIIVNSRDDGLNCSSHMYLKGGNITIVATNNDAIDSNGNMYISGGVIRAFGSGAPECGIDANEEEGYSVYFTGGQVLAVGGGSNSTPSSSESTQAYLTVSGSATAGSTISVSDGTTTLATFTVPANYTGTSGGSMRPAPSGGGSNSPGSSGGGILITCPGLVSGSSYTVTIGSTTTTATAQQSGGGGMRP